MLYPLFKTLWLFVLLLFITPSLSAAPALPDTVQLRSTTEAILLGKQATFFEDPSGKLTIADIQQSKIQQQFKPNKTDVYSRPASRSAVWAKIILANHTGQDTWLEAGGSYSCWYIDYYQPDSLGRYGKPIETGSMRPEKNKPYPVNFYWLPLAEEHNSATQTYYVRFSGGLPKQYPLKIGTLITLEKETEVYDTLTTVFVGWMLAMIFYHLILGVTTKDRIYFIYTGCLAFSLINTTYLNNYAVLTGDFWRRYHFVWFNINFLYAFYFAKEYLQLSKNAPHLIRIIWLLTAVCIIFPLLNVFGVEVVDLANTFQVIVAICSLLLLYVAVNLWRKGFRQGKIYTLGWSVTIFSIIIMVILLQTDLLPYNFYTRNILYFGVTLQVLVFSMALADRLNTMRREKQHVQAENMRLMNDQNTMLEQKVKERTAELEKQKKKVEAQARNLKEVNATKDKLLSIVGHDLRGSIGSLRDLLMMDDINTITPEDFLMFKPQLQENVSNLYEALDNLLLWSYSQMKGMKSKPELLKLSVVATQTTTLLAEIAKKKQITISREIPPELMVYADHNQVDILMRNLISNALKFTPTGGTITLTARNNQKMTEIAVADTGIGMSRDQLDKLFKVNAHFSTYGTNGETGTGLGLLLCYEMAELNKGAITVASEQNKGTTFTVSLPAAN